MAKDIHDEDALKSSEGHTWAEAITCERVYPSQKHTAPPIVHIAVSALGHNDGFHNVRYMCVVYCVCLCNCCVG